MDVPREELPTLEPHNCNLTFPVYPLALSNISSYLGFSIECRTFYFKKILRVCRAAVHRLC